MKFNQIGLLTAATLLLSCSNNNSSQKVKIPTPKMVQVPALYNTQEEAINYLAEHFWDSTNLNDTLYLERQESLDKFFIEYIKLLLSSDSTTAVTAIERWGGKVANYPLKMRQYLLNSAEDILFNPNSPLREEALYIPFLEGVLAQNSIDSLYRQRYSRELNLAKQNRPGNSANNFSFITSTGNRMELKEFKGRSTLLLFFEPDCPLCKQSVEHLNGMEQIKNSMAKVNFLAIYTGTNIDEWEESLANFPNYWSVGIDIEREIAKNELYDRRPSPSFYFLDQYGKVIIKDGAIEHIVALIEEGHFK